jgi:hypothetical protein
MDTTQIARTILDAADVDLQLFGSRAIENLRRTPGGDSFADWAQHHPVAFHTFVRFASIAIQRLPTNSSLLVETIRDQLARLPAEIVKSFGSAHPLSSSTRERGKGTKLRGLKREDAELIQAAQAPPELLELWMNAQEGERPLLMAQWISEGKVPLVEFEPDVDETPGFFLMKKGRELLRQGKKQEGFQCLHAAFVLDPLVSGNGFTLWLANPLIEEAKEVAFDPEVLSFVSKEFGAETAASIIKLRRRE